MFCNGEGILMEKFSKNGILDSIWYASLTPPADIALEGKQGEYYYKTVLPLKEKLTETLTDEQMRLFTEYEEKAGVWHDETEKENFKYGFKMGFYIADSVHDKN